MSDALWLLGYVILLLQIDRGVAALRTIAALAFRQNDLHESIASALVSLACKQHGPLEALLQKSIDAHAECDRKRKAAEAKKETEPR